MVLLKLVGIGLIIFAFWLVRYFPGIAQYQKTGLTKSGVFIGFLSALIGLILLVVG